MTTSIKTQSSDDAFPATTGFDGGTSGLTKREFFAALALAGLCQSEDLTTSASAKYAVKLADELIDALNAESL